MLISEPEPTVPSISSSRCCLLLLLISTIGWEAPGGTSQASWGNHFLFQGEGMLDWETMGWWWLQSIRTETRVQWLSKVGLKCAEGATKQTCKAVEFHSETDAYRLVACWASLGLVCSSLVRIGCLCANFTSRYSDKETTHQEPATCCHGNLDLNHIWQPWGL